MSESVKIIKMQDKSNKRYFKREFPNKLRMYIRTSYEKVPHLPQLRSKTNKKDIRTSSESLSSEPSPNHDNEAPKTPSRADGDDGKFLKKISIMRLRRIASDNNISRSLAALSFTPSYNASATSDEPCKKAEDDISLFKKISIKWRQSTSDLSFRRSMVVNSIYDEDEVAEEPCIFEEDDEYTANIRMQPDLEDADIENFEELNLDKFYEELLYEVLNNVGCEDEEISKKQLYSYLQDAFKVNNERHKEALDAAKIRKAPTIRLNVEVIEAKDLIPKDSKILFDPFVTLNIQSSSAQRLSTTVKPETVNPKWQEHFSLPIPDNANEEVLVVEVWDEKTAKNFKAKAAKGLSKRSSQDDYEPIGRVCIPFNTIPPSGRCAWFSLEKKSKMAQQDAIRIRLSFCSGKKSRLAAQEHHHLLKRLLLYELETSNVAQYWWAGKFSSEAETIINQHAAQGGISARDLTLVRWTVYSDVHVSHPLSYSLFDSILNKLSRPDQLTAWSSAKKNAFWEAAIILLPSCFSMVRSIENTDKKCVKTVKKVLSIISKLSALPPPKAADLYPAHHYSWLRRVDPEASYSLRDALIDAVHSGAAAWFQRLRQQSHHESNEEELQCMVQIIQIVCLDLQKAREYYDKTFKTILQFRYVSVLYMTYEAELINLIEPGVTKMCCSYTCENHQQMMTSEINTGTTLFELFMLLKQFAQLGTSLCSTESMIGGFHLWFYEAVTHWLDIAVSKAKARIAKAVEVDQLLPMDETARHSSSAVDTLTIFYQVKMFWQDLDWPDAEESYSFVGKIIDDIRQCCYFYAETMSQKVMNESDISVNQEWCRAINNVDYIRSNFRPFVKDLGIADIIDKLTDLQGPIGTKRLEETVENLIENALDLEEFRILRLIDTMVEKMSPVLERLLVDCAEVLHQDPDSMELLMIYLEDSLKTFNCELNEWNFQRTFEGIWREIGNILEHIVQTNLDESRPPSFYANLQTTLKALVVNFRCSSNTGDAMDSIQENIDRIDRLLRLHAYKTSELIHLYYKDRLMEQRSMKSKPYGQLTVQCCFKNNLLEIEILSARNLLPLNPKDTCDAYVKLHFWPDEKFATVIKTKTKIQNKTLFPLFEEQFEIQLTDEQMAIEDAVIIFSVKDNDFFGLSNKYLADCFIVFSEIAATDENSKSVKQMHLTLSKPNKLDSEYLKVLEHRQNDKQARDFLKKLNKKC